MLPAGASAVVSGVGPGLGRSISVAFAREGASVTLGARTTSTQESVGEDVIAGRGRAVWKRIDVSDAEDCRALINTAAEAFRGVDVLVNSGHHKGDFTPCESSDIDGWPDVFAVNLYGPMRLIQAAIPLMRQKGGGRVINVNSGAVVSSNPRLGAYAASKSGLASVTKVLAQELGRDGIRVNGVYVSSMLGDNIREFGAEEAARLGIGVDEWLEAKSAREFALRRMPRPDDIADVVVFLASDLSRAVTGQNISANNGQWVTGAQ